MKQVSFKSDEKTDGVIDGESKDRDCEEVMCPR